MHNADIKDAFRLLWDITSDERSLSLTTTWMHPSRGMNYGKTKRKAINGYNIISMQDVRGITRQLRLNNTRFFLAYQ